MAQKGFTRILVLVGILVILGIVYFSNLYQNKNSSSSISLDCSNPQNLAGFLTRGIDKNNYYLELSKDVSLGTEFITRRIVGEPLITYPGYSILLMLRHDGRNNLLKLQNEVTKMLGDRLFTKDSINNNYTKGNIMYKLSTNNEWVIFSKFSNTPTEVPVYNVKPSDKQAEEVSSIKIKCGIKKEEFDKLYDELLLAVLVKDNIAHFNPITFSDETIKLKPETVFGIKRSHRNDVVEASVFAAAGGGGYSLWLHKTPNGWTKIYSGQQYPECDLLEGLKIEPGVDCLDKSLEKDCDINIKGTECYYRKTATVN